jgi:Na+/melibiose symporter-like transporter
LFEVAGLSTRERVEQQNDKKYTFKENFQIMFRNKPFRQILISGILRSPIQLLMLIAMTVVTYYYANGDFMNVITDNGLNWGILVRLLVIAASIFIGQFVAMAIVPSLIKNHEKKSLYNFFSIAGALPFALIYILFKIAGGDIKTSMFWVLLTGVCFLFAGAAMGGINVLQSVMIADCVDYEEYHNGVRTDGVFFSGQSFITKLSGGIASIISAFVYNLVGYSDKNINTMNDALANGADFMTYDGGSGVGKYAATMFFLISIPPAVGMLLSAIPTSKYAMTDKEHKKILDELVERRAALKEVEQVNDDVNDEVAKVLEENMEQIVNEINNIDD